MTTAVQKITLSASRNIPFNKLVLSQSNVRRIKAGISIEALAEDIAHRTLLQSLNVRAVLDAKGEETGMFEVPAGGRRFRALELLVKQKRMAKTQAVPCVVRTDGLAEEDSLAENSQREELHPLDQFRAFQTLRAKGLGEEEIAARFFVSPASVKQRLKLAAVSEKLLDVYAEDGMTLEQLMAFTVTNDHARQEQVWGSLGHNKAPYFIRRQLTEGAVRAGDRRAHFVGIAAYEAAGGIVLRDLFEDDDGGWLQDPALLDRLANEKLQAEAETLRPEGWKWIAVGFDFPYGHTHGLRRLTGETVALTEEESAACDALRAEHDALEQEYADAVEVPDEVDARLGEIETALAAFDERPIAYDPAEIARAGAFVSIDADGGSRIERGYVRREDEAPVERGAVAGTDPVAGEGPAAAGPQRGPRIIVSVIGGDATSEPQGDAEEDDGIKPLSERLVIELTAHRTLALRDALANDPGTAFTAVLHALCLGAFYRMTFGTCLEISAKSASFSVQAPGLADSASAQAIEARHRNWAAQLPKREDDLWDALLGFDADRRAALLAHCASLSVNAVHEPWNRNPARLANADTLARAVNLDMAAAGWLATVENYLGRVPKARILEAVREAKGEPAVQLIDHLKKPDMAREAERLLAGTRWVPEPLRTPDPQQVEPAPEGDGESLPAFLAEGDDDGETAADSEEPQPFAEAAE